MELRWQLNVDVSCYHAVNLVAHGKPLVDQDLEAALAEPTARLLKLIEFHNLPREFFFATLVPVAAFADSSRQLARVVLTKTGGSEIGRPVHERFTEVFADLKSAFLSVHPALLADLARSVHDLQKAWEDHGRFVLNTIGELTEPDVIASQADVILIHAARNGGGNAHLLYNSVSLETHRWETTQPTDDLLRLVWLLSQLNIDLPMFQGEIHRDRLVEIAALAMLPAMVTAAAKIDLLRDDIPTLAELIETWEILDEQPESGQTATALATILTQWWRTYSTSRPRWTVALAALDRML